jgi:DNA-binding IscR family transcriptional regulator
MSAPKVYNFETSDGKTTRRLTVADIDAALGHSFLCTQCKGFNDYCADVARCETCRGRGLWPADLEALHKLRERQLLAQAPANADQT